MKMIARAKLSSPFASRCETVIAAIRPAETSKALKLQRQYLIEQRNGHTIERPAQKTAKQCKRCNQSINWPPAQVVSVVECFD